MSVRNMEEENRSDLTEDVCVLSSFGKLKIVDGSKGDNSTRGRSVIAKQTIASGECLLSNSSTSHLLLTSYWGSRCVFCCHSKESTQSSSFRLSRCAKCQLATYCGRSCQQRDWSSHKLECSKLKHLWNQYPSQILDEVLLLLRQISSDKSQAKSSLSHPENTHCHVTDLSYHETTKKVTKCCGTHVANLFSHENLLSYQSDYFYQQIVRIVCQYTQQPESAVTKLLNQFHCNNFGIVDDLMNCIGMGVYPNIALLNHSCAPNCILRFLFTEEGPIAEVVSIREIHPGEEITHSYTDCTNPRVIRQQSLASIYQFNCKCSRCQLESQSDPSEKSSYQEKIQNYLITDPSIQRPLELRELLSTLHNGPTAHATLYDIDSFLTQTLLGKKPWNEKELTQKINNFYEKIYQGLCKTEEEEELFIQELVTIDEQQYSLYYGPFHYELYRLRCKILTVLVLTGKVAEAYRYCCQVVSYLTLALINMPAHPLLGTQLFTLGDLAQTIDASLSNKYYKWAYEILSVCYDEYNPLRQKLQECTASTIIEN